jgi:pimeloyl-ACP methyl ester carboxylesterase
VRSTLASVCQVSALAQVRLPPQTVRHTHRGPDGVLGAPGGRLDTGDAQEGEQVLAGQVVQQPTVGRTKAHSHALPSPTRRRLAARYRLPVAARYLDLAEPRLRVRVLEVGEGRPLLLHGVTLLADHWAPLLAKLRGFRCIAVDLPGHGRSDPVDFRRLPLRRWYVGMLGALLDRLGLLAAPVVGHSLGGILGLWLALDAPRRVQALVVMGAPAVALPGSHADLLLALLATRRWAACCWGRRPAAGLPVAAGALGGPPRPGHPTRARHMNPEPQAPPWPHRSGTRPEDSSSKAPTPPRPRAPRQV